MESKRRQLELLIAEGESLTPENSTIRSDRGDWAAGFKPKWINWESRVRNTIYEIVSEDSGPAKTLKAGLAVKVLDYGNDHFVKAKDIIIAALQETLNVTNEDRFNELRKSGSKNISSQISNKIFIVHGHDHNFKHELEIFLTEIGLQPIVLHREADEGKTIIEKFEKHSDVGYAFILLSPDEIAYTSDQDKLEDTNRTKEHRARPNVIFEFGYFVGKLSRERVCCLIKGNVTRPSDLDGLVYKRIDNNVESEGYSIIKELKAAGYALKI